MSIENTWQLRSTTSPPNNHRRIRIDGRLNSVGDTVFIVSIERNGTIIDIRPNSVWVLPHYILLNPIVGNYSPADLRHGEGIGSLHRAWLNGLEVYHFDPILCADL